jgi:putative RecB family exonuclease
LIAKAETHIRSPVAGTIASPSPNEIAVELTGRDYISYSAMSTYQKCPLRYYFSYVAQVPPAFVPSSLTFGGAVHSAIEHHFRLVFEGQSRPSLDDLVGVYDDAWRSESAMTIRLGKSESVKGLRDLAARMLNAFQGSEVSQLDSGLLGVEEELRGPVIDSCPDVLGRLDLLALELELKLLRVIDFKTARSAWNEGKLQEAAPQQLLYAELVRPLAQALGNRPIRPEWAVITKTKQPSVELHTLTPDAKQIARTKATVRNVWQAIAGEHFYPAPSAMNCSTCPFQDACRKWQANR